MKAQKPAPGFTVFGHLSLDVLLLMVAGFSVGMAKHHELVFYFLAYPMFAAALVALVASVPRFIPALAVTGILVAYSYDYGNFIFSDSKASVITLFGVALAFAAFMAHKGIYAKANGWLDPRLLPSIFSKAG